MDEFKELYLSELSELLVDVVPDSRYIWLQSMTRTDDLLKIQTGMGYLMALKELGHEIGDMKLCLENIRSELSSW